jgi:hypothetical protein
MRLDTQTLCSLRSANTSEVHAIQDGLSLGSVATEVENESGMLSGTIVHIHSIQKDEETGPLASEDDWRFGYWKTNDNEFI